MIEPYATIDEFRTICDISDSDVDKASQLLVDATAMLIKRGFTAQDEVDSALLRSVCIAMVQRAMPPKGAATVPGVSQFTQSAGPYSETFTISNPAGKLYISRDELKTLRSGRSSTYSIRAAIHAPGGEPIDNW